VLDVRLDVFWFTGDESVQDDVTRMMPERRVQIGVDEIHGPDAFRSCSEHMKAPYANVLLQSTICKGSYETWPSAQIGEKVRWILPPSIVEKGTSSRHDQRGERKSTLKS
jgi:hypothetical protein